MSIQITDAKYEHLPEIVSIERACFSLPWSLELLEKQISGENRIFLVAQNENAVIMGYVSLQYVLDEGYIANVACAEVFRRQGVGEALIAALTQRGQQLKLAFLTLEVRESNTPAIALYKKQGFKAVGTRKNYYEKPRENAILMTIFL